MADDSVVVHDDDDESKIVTKFLLNTCRLLQSIEHHVQAVAFCFAIATDELVAPTNAEKFHSIPLITGSSAEFYIQPMLPFVGDVDVMYHKSNQLAIPEGYAPPTELPAEFHSRVKVYEIVDSGYPGYVYLPLSYLLTEVGHTGKYNFIQYDKSYIAGGSPNIADFIHGPAMTIPGNDSDMPFDQVPCVRCLSWPPQASDWPTRQRNYDWPDSATVDHVVNNGCDVVQVAHRLCRQDERMSKYQWRLSFSRAEIALLNSWMPLQQIVYHMLRFFVKTERLTDITDSIGTKTISNYHLKTLILWACEVKPQNWWMDDMNVVSICIKLLHIFTDWLESKTCPHYFVNHCNLIHNTQQHMNINVKQLSSITESWLSTWFVNNYLLKCVQLCPDVSTSTKLQSALSAVVDWRRKSALYNLWRMCSESGLLYVHKYVSECSLTALLCRVWINELMKIDSCLHDYFTAVAFLHVANRISKHSFSDDLLDVLVTLVGQFDGRRRYCHQLSSELSLRQAVILMKVIANNSRTTVQRIEFELSKSYLHRALRCKDSDSDSVYCLANVYLAVLYYTSGRYQAAIDHCTLVTRSQDHSQCSSHVVQGDLLPKVDDDIDIMLGLAVFYQYVRTAALNQQQTQYVVVFTTELFAHYLYIRCLSVLKYRHFTKTPSTDEVQRHIKCIIDMDQLFIADVLLVRSIITSSELRSKCHYKPLAEQRQNSTINVTEWETSELVELLQQSAVEHLTAFRQLKALRFGSIATIITTDFEALYAYKHSDYQRCLQMSSQNVRTPLYVYLEDMWTFPEFIQLMDDDIVSLTALTLIVNRECRDFNENVRILQVTLSLYLMTQCQLKLRHSVTSLAQTLDYIEVAERRCPVHRTLDRLVLKLTRRKIMINLSKIM